MYGNINLLKRAKTPQVFKHRIKSILNVVSLVSIIFFVFATLALFLTNFFLASKIRGVNQKIKTLELKLNALSQVELRQWALTDKLVSLEKILANEVPFDVNIREMGKILPSDADASISQLTLGESKFSVSVSSGRLSTLNQFISNLVSPELGGKHFTKIVLESLSVDDKGVYRMSISGEIL